jgi:RNA polymerase sigma factor (sigma-70 family)
MTSAATDWVTGPMDQPSDADLIEASRSDPERFAEIYDRHAVPVHRYLARRVGSRGADDLASETFLVAFRLRERYDLSHEHALPWLYGIATNLLRRHHRTERANYRLLARTGVDPLAGLDHADEVVLRVAAEAEGRTVAAALARLTAKERDVLLLFAWAGLAYEEIAAALDIPTGTVRSRLNRARERLRNALNKIPTISGELP